MLAQTAVVGDIWQNVGVKMLNEAGQEQLTQTSQCCTQFGTKNIPAKAERNPPFFLRRQRDATSLVPMFFGTLLPKWL